MTRPRLSRAVVSVVAILALATFLVCSMHRARAAGGEAQAKKPAAGRTAAAAGERPASKPPSKPVASTNATPSTPPPLGSAAPPGSVEVVPSTPAPLASTGAPASATEQGEKGSAEEPDLSSIPVGGGLPVMIDVAVSVIELQSFDDVKGEFEATTDLRLRWTDPRLRFQATGATGSYLEYRAKEAEDRLAKLWTPNIDVVNRLETSGYVGRRLRIFPDGLIESMVRSNGRYKIDVDVQNFPFDVQALRMTMLVRDQTTDHVVLHFDKDDEEFSSATSSVRMPSWQIGDVDLDADLVSGWNGDRYSRVMASLMVTRSSSTGLTTIFIPLLASLLIPLLALWMNRPTQEGFEIPAFELANMGIGGLFSVIALSFAVSSSYSSIAGSDNTVTRLFALNYATLALSLGIVVLLYRGNLVLRHFGPYVHEQVFRYVLWAVPLLTLATSVAFVAVAAC